MCTVNKVYIAIETDRRIVLLRVVILIMNTRHT